MKTLILVVTALIITSCSNTSGTNQPPYTPPPVTQPPTDEPPVDEPPIDEPPVEEPSAPVVYNTTNHPMTGKTYTNAAYRIVFNSNGTYTLTDSFHITYGYWVPDSNPAHIIETLETVAYPVTLTSSGMYQCLPLTGPQNCTNTGFAGAVKVRSSKVNPYTELVIYY